VSQWHYLRVAASLLQLALLGSACPLSFSSWAASPGSIQKYSQWRGVKWRRRNDYSSGDSI